MWTGTTSYPTFITSCLSSHAQSQSDKWYEDIVINVLIVVEIKEKTHVTILNLIYTRTELKNNSNILLIIFSRWHNEFFRLKIIGLWNAMEQPYQPDTYLPIAYSIAIVKPIFCKQV